LLARKQAGKPDGALINVDHDLKHWSDKFVLIEG
jgi:hypothetical protein